jgi:hypothetical protein
LVHASPGENAMETPARPNSDLLEMTLTMAGDTVTRLVPLLGEGIWLSGTDGETVEDFLVKTAGISPAYLRERVQTVFLNGRALDDFNTARVRGGATLALSAAMPGLAGAVLRRGGVYAPMRRPISHEAQSITAGSGRIFVILKLFNMIARELGPNFLKDGVLIPGAQLRDFMERRGGWSGCLSAEADGQPVPVAQVADLIASRKWLRLAVRPAG